MEQHPVPQNVTTFQFRLVGDMTLKQFGYLASGVLLAYISSKLPLPFFFTWPMMLFFGFGGFGLAFVPVEERPMDIWIASFLRNTYNPTQYVWQKKVRAEAVTKIPPPAPSPTRGETTLQKPKSASLFSMIFSGFWPDLSSLQTLFRPAPKQATKPAQPIQKQPHTSSFDTLTRMFQHTQNNPQPVPPALRPTIQINPSGNTNTTPVFTMNFLSPFVKFLDSLWGIPKPNVVFNTVLSPAPILPTVRVAPPIQPHTWPIQKPEPTIAQQDRVISKAIMEAEKIKRAKDAEALRMQNEKLGNELDRIKKQTSDANAKSQIHQNPTPVPMSTTGATVRTITGDTAVTAGIPKLTTFPNIVTGIVKDERGNLLPGALVTVRDPEGVPLRALKTNRLGQFAASTPLPPGTYLVEVEDPMKRYVFDRAKITTNNTLLPALEMHAKTQKQVNRDNLARVIFGDQTP